MTESNNNNNIDSFKLVHHDEKDPKLKQFLKKVQDNAKHIVFFTGAGISTSTGLADFKSKVGILGLREHELDMINPSYSHLAISELIKEGVAQGIVTSNHDDLHYKACPAQGPQICELFGNAYIEKCLSCKKLIRRNVMTPNIGRKCELCGGRLTKSGVRYGEAVPEEPLKRAYEYARSCGLAIVLGSSMGTSPFCDLPPYAKNGVDNDPNCLKLEMKCDTAMKFLMKELCETKVVPIQDPSQFSFTFSQQFLVGWAKQEESRTKFFVKSPFDNEPVTAVQGVTLQLGTQSFDLEKNKLVWEHEETGFRNTNLTKVTFTVEFSPEYQEPAMAFEMDFSEPEASRRCVFEHKILV